MRTASPIGPDDPVVPGPIGAAAFRWDDWVGVAGTRLIYADLDLAERAATTAALGLPPDTADEAIVLAAFGRWGLDSPAHLGGQFAFALWDGPRRRLVAARDVVGCRPLVHSTSATVTVIGGDLRAVLATDGVDTAIDEDVFVTCVLWNGDSRLDRWGRTCYRAVDTVRPAHVLIVDRGCREQRRYWHPEDVAPLPPANFGDHVAALGELLDDVVADLTPADGIVGVHLSGGLDSSIVTALAAADRHRRGVSAPVALAWQPAPDRGGGLDHERIEAVRSQFALPLHFCPSTVASHLAEATADATADPVTMLRHEWPTLRTAADLGVTTVLSGWGGDDAVTFSGSNLAVRELLRGGRVAPVLRSAVEHRSNLRTVAAAALPWRPWRRDGPRGWHQPVERRRRDALDGIRPTALRPDVLRRAELLDSPLPPRAVHDRIAWRLANGHLGTRAADWNLSGATSGVRYRFPLLDRRLIEFALALPPEAWLPRDGRNRALARAATNGRLADPARLSAKSEPIGMQHHADVARLARTQLRVDVHTADRQRLALFDTDALERGIGSDDDAAWLAVRWLGVEPAGQLL